MEVPGKREIGPTTSIVQAVTQERRTVFEIRGKMES